jgi:hypothetical protein
MKYWRWKCQPCGREITIPAGAVPKPCHLCSSWDFLKLGETDDKNATHAQIIPGQVKMIFHDDISIGDFIEAIRAAGWRMIYATNDGPKLEFTPATDRRDKS